MRVVIGCALVMAMAACSAGGGGEKADATKTHEVQTALDAREVAADLLPADPVAADRGLPDSREALADHGDHASGDVGDAPQPDTADAPGEDREEPGSDPGPDAPSPCQDGIFAVTDLQLKGNGFAVQAAPGESVLVVASWRVGNPPDCPSCARQIVLGIEDEAAGCMAAGVPRTCPDATEGKGLMSLVAPQGPGTYTVYAASLPASQCSDAKAAYSQARKIAVGVLHVGAGCEAPACPETPCTPITCDAIAKTCGTWGDGCRHDLPCGDCPAGTACVLAGLCEGPCAAGILEPSDVHVGGSGPVASAEAGQDVPFTFDLAVGNRPDCEGCERLVLAGFNSAAHCQSAGVVETCPAYDTLHVTGSVLAPLSPGAHTLWAVVPEVPAGTGCNGDIGGLFASSPRRVAVATVQVHAGCAPVSCEAAGKDCGPSDDGCGFQVECGVCEAGDTCSAGGVCGCSADDPYEPNQTQGTAHDLGGHTDSDAESGMVLQASIQDEADWYRIHATDTSLAVLDPFVKVNVARTGPFHVVVAYTCADGKSPALTVGEDSSCAPSGAAFACDSDGSPVVVHFEPTCAGTLDDSGTLTFAVSSSGYCSSYTVELHL